MKITRPFYIISSRSDLKTLSPSIPNNFLTRGKYVDYKLPRISVFKSIEDAIAVTYLGEKLQPGTKVYVYEVQGIERESLIGPLSISEIPYSQTLKEWWYLKPISLKFVSEVEIGKLRETKIYYYGPRQTKAYVYKWGWREIIPKYQEKFGPKLKKFSHSNDDLDKLNDRQLERLANKVVSHRKKERLERNKLKAAKNNTIASTETKPYLSPTVQDEATLRATKNLNYKKALRSEDSVLRKELINTIKYDNT